MTQLQRSNLQPRLSSLDHSFEFEAIGTKWVIDIYNALPKPALAKLQQAIQDRIERFDKHYSRFRSDSLVASMSQKAGNYLLPDDAKPLLDIYRDLYDLTDGAMTPLIGQVLADAGYDANYSLKPGQLKTPPKWEDALAYDFPQLQIKKPVLLDFGAVGKGYLVDIIGELLHEWGVTNFCIDAGGDILYQTAGGQRPLDVGLEHPENPQQVLGVAKIYNQSICGSSGNRRAWGAFNHIINPHLLQSPKHILALWVVADTARVADALATALFFVPASKLAKRYTFEYALLRPDLSLESSANFPAKFFTK